MSDPSGYSQSQTLETQRHTIKEAGNNRGLEVRGHHSHTIKGKAGNMNFTSSILTSNLRSSTKEDNLAYTGFLFVLSNGGFTQYELKVIH